MDTEIKNAVNAADIDAQYDDKAKRLLGNKHILAHILVKTIDEFHGMAPKDVVSYIEGEPYISTVPVDPGLTNLAAQADKQRIIGMNTENTEINEGLVRFDIIFYVRMKDSISQVIVNIEAQKDEPTSYHILDRAVFYACRLVSSQKERDFAGINYNEIKRIFSIWICMNMNENIMDYIHLTDDKLLGCYPWKGRLNLLNIVLIGITSELPDHDDKYELHRLLSTLFSTKLSVREKLDIIETEYNISVNDKFRKDVDTMCNLSQGIREMGEAEGEARGRAEGEARERAEGEARGRAEGEARMIMNMHQKGYTPEQIADIAEKSIEEIEAIIKQKELILA